jgi:hypothetical protein
MRIPFLNLFCFFDNMLIFVVAFLEITFIDENQITSIPTEMSLLTNLQVVYSGK